MCGVLQREQERNITAVSPLMHVRELQHAADQLPDVSSTYRLTIRHLHVAG